MPKFETVTEGKAKLYVSKGKISKELPVFYNPAKELDRDLSVLFLRAAKKKTVLDLLAASGARGIRLAKEAGAKVTYNDVSAEAVKILKKNLKLNKLKSPVFNMTANNFLGQCSDKFDFVDIDPFGSPILFVFNSIRRLDKDGYLAVTATDTAPLYGVYKWTCFRKYGSFPIKTNFSHEIGIRILAKAVIELAAKWNISLTPVFAHADHYYYRIYFHHKRSHVEELGKQIGFINYCPKCGNRFASGFDYPQKCNCGEKLQHAGPLYLGKLWEPKLIEEMIKVQEKLKWGTRHSRFLRTLIKESQVSAPYFFEPADFFTVEPKSYEIFETLEKAGIKAVPTHFAPKGFRTDASFEQLKSAFKTLSK
jgi:tRNA (guanine26-N2/guanine27-N2)-dimethyltransferase